MRGRSLLFLARAKLPLSAIALIRLLGTTIFLNQTSRRAQLLRRTSLPQQNLIEKLRRQLRDL